ncbi:rad50 zinc hook motif domain-containing protein [Phthorimaea operculella]|nr:rad50 zinc hook motif domain-containing protein [Phthorimaea operculella]
MPESGYAMQVNKFEVKMKGEVDGIKKKLKTSDREMTKLETERKHVREMLNDKKAELTKAEDKMFKACGAQTYEETLAKVTAQVEKLQEEHAVLQASMTILAKYKQQVKDNSCCPLCNRGFDGETEVSDLVDHLSTQVMTLPSRLEKASEELQKTQAQKDELLSLKSLNEKITALKETDIPKLETRQSDVDKKIADLQTTIEELQTSMKEPEEKLATAKSIQGDMPLLDRSLQELKTATRDFESAKSKTEGMEMDMTVEDATARQTELKQKITTLKAKIKAARAKLNQHAKKINQMQEKKNKIKEELLNIQKKVQEIVNLQENKKQIEENRARFVTELEQLQSETAPLEQVLKDKEQEKANVVNKNRSAIELKNSYIQNIVNSFDKVKSIDNEIKQHKERNIQKEMDKINEANEKLKEKHKKLMDDRDTLTKRIDTLKDELAKQEINKRDLEDNLKLRKAQTEIESCAKEEAEVNEKLSGVNADMLQEKEPLIQQQTTLFREKAQLEGRVKQMNDDLKALKKDLQKAQNKDIEKRFREKFYELQVTKAIEKDINNYAVALEKCLMEFHKEKMEHINLIIREMWRKIYRGNDIDYIEIKTEGTITTDSDRRKYDYRVVQCKNGIEIDMRGRCSAGQKVLACLIIRLALAETFSSRFGILALDEPTTNLDDENVRSLCAALGEIVQERMRQKNFMFIIITHDKEFIDSQIGASTPSEAARVFIASRGKRPKKLRGSPEATHARARANARGPNQTEVCLLIYLGVQIGPNLDDENVRSLCAALGEIVQERMRQKNFMFIIITHDKEFIESLGNIDKVTTLFYRSPIGHNESSLQTVQWYNSQSVQFANRRVHTKRGSSRAHCLARQTTKKIAWLTRGNACSCSGESARAEPKSTRLSSLPINLGVQIGPNLDDENVRSLCAALGEIVQERMRQKNFMFIIITHDKEFIESLGNIDKIANRRVHTKRGCSLLHCLALQTTKKLRVQIGPNLDDENVRSLCAALGEIVQERMRQKNFMFIIITHDKEFIESLGNIDKVTALFLSVGRKESTSQTVQFANRRVHTKRGSSRVQIGPNLDDENVRSLCAALGEIVQERMRQKNFMFIIITHDKEFIESLGNIDKVTTLFYRSPVGRNESNSQTVQWFSSQSVQLANRRVHTKRSSSRAHCLARQTTKKIAWLTRSNACSCSGEHCLLIYFGVQIGPNLDDEIVRSLCAALGEIVQERMRQKNFMFIIITHDKEFIESLGNIDKVTHYYEVSRNDDGKSRIKKIRFS